MAREIFNLKISIASTQTRRVFSRVSYQSAESILGKYKFNITRSSVKKHDTLFQKMRLRGTARCERAEACFSSMPPTRNARLACCLIKSVAIVNNSIRKPLLNIHTQNSDAQKITILDVLCCLPYALVHPVSINDISTHLATATKKYL